MIPMLDGCVCPCTRVNNLVTIKMNTCWKEEMTPPGTRLSQSHLQTLLGIDSYHKPGPATSQNSIGCTPTYPWPGALINGCAKGMSQNHQIRWRLHQMRGSCRQPVSLSMICELQGCGLEAQFINSSVWLLLRLPYLKDAHQIQAGQCVEDAVFHSPLSACSSPTSSSLPGVKYNPPCI